MHLGYLAGAEINCTDKELIAQTHENLWRGWIEKVKKDDCDANEPPM